MTETTERILKNLIPEARTFMKKILKERKEDSYASTGDYGHAARGLALPLLGAAETNRTPEEQRELLRGRVQKLVDEFGPKILDFLGKEYDLVVDEFRPKTS